VVGEAFGRECSADALDDESIHHDDATSLMDPRFDTVADRNR
jgi:hypothetical protein